MNYWKKLVEQKESAKQSNAINFYLKNLYEYFNDALIGKNDVLEIGAGAGTSLNFIESSRILRTDILSSGDSRILGEIDVHELPFESQSFDIIIGMDILHHLQKPSIALMEAKRCVRTSQPGLKLIFIEPYVSIASFLPYKLFHNEKTSIFRNRNLKEPLVGADPNDGDQTLPRIIFDTKKGQKLTRAIFPVEEYTITIFYISFLSFFATGGINRPLPTPLKLIKAITYLESLFPQWIMKKIGSRMVIKIHQK